jgi:hypothetical protein
MFAAFAGNNTWFGILLGVHIAGAIIGLGPTFAFGIMAGTAKKTSPERALGILEVTHAVQGKLVEPLVGGVQLVTGVGLIFNRGLQHGFFSHRNGWLIASLVIYATAMGISNGIQGPTMKKALALANDGKAGTPEFGGYIQRLGKFGPVLGILGFALVVLMIWRPGSGCSVPTVC